MPKQYSVEIRDEIINKLKNEGAGVSELSREYGISAKSIYKWIRAGVPEGNRNLILENARLKKELDMAYRMLGKATAILNHPKN